MLKLKVFILYFINRLNYKNDFMVNVLPEGNKEGSSDLDKCIHLISNPSYICTELKDCWMTY